MIAIKLCALLSVQTGADEHGCGVCTQDARPSASHLLELPLIYKHEAQQEQTMSDWLLLVGEPSGKPAGTEEAPVFMHWNSNPLLPPPTPQSASKRALSPTPCTAVGVQSEGAELESDLSRVPLQFLSQSQLDTFDAEMQSIKKKAKAAPATTFQTPSSSS